LIQTIFNTPNTQIPTILIQTIFNSENSKILAVIARCYSGNPQSVSQ
jgi:hypothetical protein